jgi:hypothetical protein
MATFKAFEGKDVTYIQKCQFLESGVLTNVNKLFGHSRSGKDNDCQGEAHKSAAGMTMSPD